MKINVIEDKIKDVWRSLTKEELEEHVQGGEDWRPNRASVRSYRRSLRRKGPGYTRMMRKGRGE